MESKQAKVRCPHCSVEFNFGLPQKYVERPKKQLKFMCEYCTEKFSILVADLFSEDDTELAALKIRHQSVHGLILHDSWEELILSASSQEIGSEDPISAFGDSWKPASIFSELRALFPEVIEEEDAPVENIESDAAEQIPDVVVEVEEEPSYENDMFMDDHSQEPPWDDVASDPFDIPIMSEESFDEEREKSDHEEGEELVDLIAHGAMDSFLEESEEVITAVEEESEDPFLAISDEVEVEGDHSIDALLSTLESGFEEENTTLGTNTLELLQSEEAFESEEVQPLDTPPVVFEDPSQEVVVVEEDSEDLEMMQTVIGDPGFLNIDNEPEEDKTDTVVAENDEFLSSTTPVSEEDSLSRMEQTQTIISEPDWNTGAEKEKNEEDGEDGEDGDEDAELDFFSPASWEEEPESSGNGSESIDYDQTEEEESQSVLNPAFQMSTKKVVRKQYWAVAGVALFSLITAVLFSRYFSLSDVSSFFVPIDDVTAQDTALRKRMAKKASEKKIQQKQAKKENPVAATKETVQEAPKTKTTPETPIAKVDMKSSEKKSMMVVSPKKSVFLEENPLVRKKSKNPSSKQSLPKLPPMDPKRATREGWIKIEDKSYESAKAIFEDVIQHEPTPEALLGIGFAEERMADRYKERKDFIRVEAHHDQAHKYYCEAMDYYTRDDTADDDLRFGIKYVQARLKVISRGCI